MLPLRGALIGLSLAVLTAVAQTPPSTPPAGTAPTGTPGKATIPPPTISATVVAASVNGEAIYETAVQRALERVPQQRRGEERPRLINFLVDNMLIDQSLRAAGYKVEQPEIDKHIGEMKAELKKANKDFDKMLGELKVSETELRGHIAADRRWFKYASAQATDKVLQDLYAAQKDMFDGSTVKARHILMVPAGKDDKAVAATVAQLRQIRKAIETEAEVAQAKLPPTTDKASAEKAKAEAQALAFAKYAKEKSECPTKASGGDVGWFQKVGYMVAPFANAAFGMQPGQMSDAVVSPFGCHLILVTERKPGREVKFEEVKEVVREVYFDKLHEGLAAQLRQKAKIEVQQPPK